MRTSGLPEDSENFGMSDCFEENFFAVCIIESKFTFSEIIELTLFIIFEGVRISLDGIKPR